MVLQKSSAVSQGSVDRGGVDLEEDCSPLGCCRCSQRSECRPVGGEPPLLLLLRRCYGATPATAACCLAPHFHCSARDCGLLVEKPRRKVSESQPLQKGNEQGVTKNAAGPVTVQMGVEPWSCCKNWHKPVSHHPHKAPHMISKRCHRAAWATSSLSLVP